MASFTFQTPSPFDFKNPSEWDKWIRRFERYREVSGLSEETEKKQVTTLIYCLGDDAEDVLQASNLDDEMKGKYDLVKEMFQTFCIGKKNIIYERARFNSRIQKVDEPIELFVTDLFKLADTCNFGNLKEELIRDRLVIGIRDTSLSEALQLDSELTLERAVQKCRQKEVVHSQQAVIRPENKQWEIAKVEKGREDYYRKNRETYDQRERFQNGGPRRNEKFPQYNMQDNNVNKCKYCARFRHRNEDCPAKKSKCYKCQKIGHYARACISKIHTIEDLEDQAEPQGFLGSVEGIQPESKWEIKLKVEGKDFLFKIDSGADVTVMPYCMLTDKMKKKLQYSNRLLFGVGKTRMEVRGVFNTVIQSSRNKTRQEVYAIENLDKPLLGKQAIEALDVIRFVNSVEDNHKRRYVKQFPKLFQGLGSLEEKHKIELESDARPVSIPVPRDIPLPLIDKVKEEIERLEGEGIIQRIEEPTPWCSGMVVVQKPNGKVRICVDLTNLNKSVKRSKLMLPSVEYTLGKLGDSTVFTRLDANSGFWQIKLSEESAKLTTFITPFGRYFFKRLPFGITSAPEYFQNQMMRILEGLEGVICHMDDILIHAKTEQQHNQRLIKVLERLQKSGLTLNEKCEFNVRTIKFLGHVISEKGIEPDPDHIEAIEGFPKPANLEEVRRFLGMVNHIGRFIPKLAEKTRAIRELLKKTNKFVWGNEQEEAFSNLKKEIKKATYLKPYSNTDKTIVSADSSSYGLGATLLQEDANGDLRPVAFASKSLNDTEVKYAQIEKEAYAITFACERFEKFLIGREFHIQTDHKPLVPLLGDRNLNTLPARIQRFKMRLFRYRFTISHVPGKELLTADALSRAPIQVKGTKLTEEVEAYVRQMTRAIPASSNRLKEIKSEQEKDKDLATVKNWITKGWPKLKGEVSRNLALYYSERKGLTIQEGLIVKDNRIVIPENMREEIVSRIHQGHMGLNRCMDRARLSVWWPGINSHIKQKVENCHECIKERMPRIPPMIASTLPNRPWEKVGVDLYEFEKIQYLIIIDYYSRYIEVVTVSNITANAVIKGCKSIFARHGIPELVISDSGTQFLSGAWEEFKQEYEFDHHTSSPHYHQSNGEAESGVKIMKKLLKKSSDIYLALLAYRATPGKLGYSPSELLMGRRLRTPVPALQKNLNPKLPNKEKVRERDKYLKEQQKLYYNYSHRVREDIPLQPGERVWVRDKGEEGIVQKPTGLPRSHYIQTEHGTLRRNVVHLARLPTPLVEEGNLKSDETEEEEVETQQNDAPYRTRSGREVKPPKRMNI